MATYSRIALSGSTNGKMISVSSTASNTVVIHTAQSPTTTYDEVWLYAVNSSTNSAKLTIEYGGTTVADQIELSVAPESGLVLVVPGLILNNSQRVTAFASTASVINIAGYVNRIS